MGQSGVQVFRGGHGSVVDVDHAVQIPVHRRNQEKGRAESLLQGLGDILGGIIAFFQSGEVFDNDFF